jgi:kynurenine formamidase
MSKDTVFRRPSATPQWLACLTAALAILAAVASNAQNAADRGRQVIATEADFRRAMKELSNWGRWGKDDELGAANLVTPAKRKQAAALVREGVTVSLSHDVNQQAAPDGPMFLERVVLSLSPSTGTDRYQFTGSYHGAIESHLDALGCHVMFEGVGWNGVPVESIDKEKGCPRAHINVLKDGVQTRGVLLDATLLPGKATPDGWLEPGTAIHRDDIEQLERLQNVRVSEGDVILLYTGRWKRRAALGAWPTKQGFGGYHPDVAYFLKERGVSFLGADMWQDAAPNDFKVAGNFPLHVLAIVSLGVTIFDNLDLEAAVQTARRLKRWTFMFTAAPLRIEHGMGSPVNALGTF